MTRFNKAVTRRVSKTTNLAGGEAFTQRPEMELVTILLTSFANDQYYRKSGDTFDRLKELISIIPDKKFVAQAAVYARTQFGMRSITHVVAAELARHAAGQPWAKNFYDKVIYRPDDMLEIASYYNENCADASVKAKRKKKSLPMAIKNGFAMAFNKFNGYALAKYRGKDRGISMIDLVNMVHPVPTEKNRDAMDLLMKDKLRNEDTWEVQLSAAGQADTEDDTSRLKAEAWSKLIREQKLGYLALLRNLRNIKDQASEALDEALAGLTNEAWIKKSLTFPFQYLVAYKQFLAENSAQARKITQALAKAVEISCQNVKTLGFTGSTLVAIDNSGSMESPVTGSEHMQKSELGALFGIVLAKAINADVMEFGDRARYIPFMLDDNAMIFAADFHNKNQVGHGTAFEQVFKKANKKYDRIFLFSDIQSWVGKSGDTSLSDYGKKWGGGELPAVYSFDLAGYGTMQFRENRTYQLAGFSDKVFDLLKNLEKDRDAMISEIKKVDI